MFIKENCMYRISLSFINSFIHPFIQTQSAISWLKWPSYSIYSHWRRAAPCLARFTTQMNESFYIFFVLYRVSKSYISFTQSVTFYSIISSDFRFAIYFYSLPDGGLYRNVWIARLHRPSIIFLKRSNIFIILPNQKHKNKKVSSKKLTRIRSPIPHP